MSFGKTAKFYCHYSLYTQLEAPLVPMLMALSLTLSAYYMKYLTFLSSKSKSCLDTLLTSLYSLLSV